MQNTTVPYDYISTHKFDNGAYDIGILVTGSKVQYEEESHSYHTLDIKRAPKEPPRDKRISGFIV